MESEDFKMDISIKERIIIKPENLASDATLEDIKIKIREKKNYLEHELDRCKNYINQILIDMQG